MTRTTFWTIRGRALLLAIVLVSTAPAATILADLDRDGNGIAGPTDFACTVGCANNATSVSVSFNGGFPPPSIPVVPPGFPTNSEIAGKAFADLKTGVMRGRAHAASFGHNEQHEIRFVSSIRETIDITVPVGLPAAERFVTFIGEVHGNATATNRALSEVLYILDVNGLRASASTHQSTGWDVLSGDGNPRIVLEPLGLGYRFRVTRAIPNSGVMVIETQLEGTAWAEGRLDTGVGIADAHAEDTAFLSMILPAGATYTSQSGVFLTQPFDAVPEPGTWLLMLSGIGLVSLVRRRRSSVARR
jgi:hypothetical protein